MAKVVCIVAIVLVSSVVAQYPSNRYLPASAGRGAQYSQQQAGGAYSQQQAGGAYRQQQAGGAYRQQQAGGAYRQQQAGGAYRQQQAAAYPQQQYGAPAGYPGQRSGYGAEDANSEPANYEFSYEVSAPEYNVEFGHQEQRQGEEARGNYHVLLPDGRKQTVDYIANQDGYQPTITYQETNANGYGNGAAAGYGANGNGYARNGNGPYRAGATAYASQNAGGY